MNEKKALNGKTFLDPVKRSYPLRAPSMLNVRKRVPENCLVVIILLFAFLFCFHGYVFRNVKYFLVNVQGTSMQNVIEDGDLLYADRFAVPKRGDVVIVDVTSYYSEWEQRFYGQRFIKRLVAIEGDCIKCEDGVLYRKEAGETEYSPVYEPYIEYPTFDFEEFVIGEGEIFFLGDHRDISVDSRNIDHMFRMSDIVGVVPEWSIKYKDIITAYEKFMHAGVGRKIGNQ